jgi:hypothetical protein
MEARYTDLMVHLDLLEHFQKDIDESDLGLVRTVFAK